MALDTAISLTTLSEIKSFLGASPQKDGIWIYCSGVTVASVEVTDTALVLIDKATVVTAHRAVTTNVATVATATAHGLIAGNNVVISGMADAAYNGIFTVVSAPNTTHFTFALTHADEVETVDTGGTVVKATVLTFADADKDTISELITAINAVTGWKSGAIYNGSAPSTDLIVTGALSCLGSANEITLKIADDYLLIELINRASDLLNRYCERTLKTTAYTLERYNGEAEKLFLYNYPVTNVIQVCDGIIDAIRVRYTLTTAYNAYVEVIQGTSVKLIREGVEDADIDTTLAANDTLGELAAVINAVANWEGAIANSLYSTYPSSQLFTKYNYACNNQNNYLQIPDEPIDDYDMDYEKGIIYLPSRFSQGFQNIYCSYTGGFVSIPYALEQICVELVKFKYNQSDKDLSLKSEQIGTVYRYTLGDLKKALSDSQMDQLDLFRSRNL